jgi:serine/threonine protein kinase
MNYTLVGRQDFICPEIERREHYYFEADIFCLGLTLLVLMSKENPIINTKFFRIINDENMFEYNSYLKKLILKMLNKKYFLRPNASEALHELNLIEKSIKI